MTTKQKILQIITDAVTAYNAPLQAAQDAYNAAQKLADPEWEDVPYIPTVYGATYDEARMMNVNVDEKALGSFFAYVEEFQRGTYEFAGFARMKRTQIEVYFLTFCEYENTADDRDALRTQIENEIVYPFIKQLEKGTYFEKPTTFNWESTSGRFDANEVGIMLSFEILEQRPC